LGDGIGAAEEAGDFFEWALRGGEADALEGRVAGGSDEGFEPFDGEGEVRASLGGDEGVDLVDDEGLDVAESFGGVGGEEEVEGLGRGDEDFAGVAAESGALLGGCVAGTDADLREVHGDAGSLGHVGDAGERGTEVALDVDREGFERGDVDDAGAGVSRAIAEHELVEAPEEGGEGFAGAGWGEYESGLGAGNGWPAVALGWCGLVEDGSEPACGDGVEEGEGVRGCRFGRCSACGFLHARSAGYFRSGWLSRHQSVTSRIVRTAVDWMHAGVIWRMRRPC
jgi:hypothetical protein